MPKLIKLTYQQLIDSSSEDSFEKAIFDSSYQEFLTKFQAYNKEERFVTFNELLEKDGRANSLHFKLTFASGHILDSLNKRIPNLRDQLGNQISFKFAELHLLDSSIEDQALHKVAIRYTTKVLILHEIIGDYLLLSVDKDFDWERDELRQTFMVKTQQGLSISAYCEKTQTCLTEGSLRIGHNGHLFSELGIL